MKLTIEGTTDEIQKVLQVIETTRNTSEINVRNFVTRANKIKEMDNLFRSFRNL